MTAVPRTILIVEDNPDDLFAIQRALRKANIRNPVAVVTDGRDALDYLAGVGRFADRALYPLPFMMFLDLKLPYVDGFDVLAWLRARAELDGIVVIVLTSSDEDRDHRRAYALGARSYLVKPPTADALVQLAVSLRSLWGSASGHEGPLLIGNPPV
jgi:CheY-like chemotaxis protein